VQHLTAVPILFTDVGKTVPYANLDLGRFKPLKDMQICI